MNDRPLLSHGVDLRDKLRLESGDGCIDTTSVALMHTYSDINTMADKKIVVT